MEPNTRPGLIAEEERRDFDQPPACAVLLPDRPRPDVEELLGSADLSAIWKDGSSFVDNANGRFT